MPGVRSSQAFLMSGRVGTCLVSTQSFMCRNFSARRIPPQEYKDMNPPIGVSQQTTGRFSASILPISVCLVPCVCVRAVSAPSVERDGAVVPINDTSRFFSNFPLCSRPIYPLRIYGPDRVLIITVCRCVPTLPSDGEWGASGRLISWLWPSSRARSGGSGP